MAELIEYRQLARILSMFMIVQLAGIAIAFYVISPAFVTVNAGGTSASPQVIYVFAYIIVTAIIMVLLFRSRKGPLFFRILEFLAVVTAAFYLFLILLSVVFPPTSLAPLPIALVAALGVMAAKIKWPGLRNFAAIIASVGVGLVLGIYFSFPLAYALMALLAVYDYVAVFVTKHMVTLGRQAVDLNLAFMIGAYDMEVMPKGAVKDKEIKDVNKAVAQSKNKTLQNLVKAGNVPMPSFSALGAGDLAMPLMLEISAFGTYFKFFTSLVIMVGAVAGLIFSMWVSKKYKTALPAIPPLFAFASIALGLEFLVMSPLNWAVYAILFALSAGILLLIIFTAMRQNKSPRSRILPPD